MSALFKNEIINQLEKLNTEQQKKVLDFVKALSNKKVSGKELLKFSGTIEKNDLDLMSKAIEEDCENINIDEW
jgi:hypothetical protein